MVMKVEDWLGKENKIGIDIFNKKYRFNNETFEGFLDRVSDGDDDLRGLIRTKKFLFAGRILANYNTGTKAGTVNCITLGYVEDNLNSIMDTAKDLAMSFKAEAGVGLALSKIRPKGARIGANGTSDGVLGFLKIFASITENISRGGARRGASFMGLGADHPDIIDFIRLKKNNKGGEGVVLSANLSVLITDEFMTHYADGTTYHKDFIVESTGEVIEHTVDPKVIMNEIVDLPERAFEPGILFIDRFNETHLFGSVIDKYVLMVNACTEYVGIPNTSCVLGSLNIAEFVNEYGFLDTDELISAIRVAIGGLDRVVDYSMPRCGTKKQSDISMKYRSIGLGITGLADAFVKMGIKYGDKESIAITNLISKLMSMTSKDESIKMGIELGQPNGILEYESDPKFKGIKGLRNNSLLSIAPAGSLSAMLGVSSGIEPIFRHSYQRMTQSVDGNDMFYTVHHKASKDVIDANGGNIPDYLVDSSEIDYMDKINIMKAVQAHVDLSISSTVNLPKGTTVDTIKNVYVESWKAGLKGNTIYVDGSISGVLNEIDNNEETSDCSS